MIVFDLQCRDGHVFEAWFKSSAAYETQRAAGHIACPICDDRSVTKALMAPAIARSARSTEPDGRGADAAMLTKLAAIQRQILQGSRYVGHDFATTARSMHDGDEPCTPIHGRATPADAKALIDDGIPVAPLPFPVVPPEALN